MDKKQIVIRIFRRTCDGFTKFEAICSENIVSYISYFATNMLDLADDLARDIKISSKKSKSINIEFPRNIYKIHCEIPIVKFYESVSDGEIKVFWERFGKAVLQD